MEQRHNRLFVYVLVFLLGMTAGSLALAQSPTAASQSPAASLTSH